MKIQDKLERILREMHILLSRAPSCEDKEGYIQIQKKEMQRQLGNLSQAVQEVMDAYEVTQQSRNRKELEAENQRMEILRDANHQAQDIYAASVIYSEDALGRIQDIIDEAEQASRKILRNLSREMEEEKRIIRSNQTELITQLEDMKDTAKYMKLIEERNREITKEKAKKQEKGRQESYRRRESPDDDAIGGVVPEVKVNEEYLKKAGLKVEEPEEEKVVYEKPVIKVNSNSEYFRQRAAAESLEDDEAVVAEELQDKNEDKKGKGFFSFGRK